MHAAVCNQVTAKQNRNTHSTHTVPKICKRHKKYMPYTLEHRIWDPSIFCFFFLRNAKPCLLNLSQIFGLDKRQNLLGNVCHCTLRGHICDIFPRSHFPSLEILLMSQTSGVGTTHISKTPTPTRRSLNDSNVSKPGGWEAFLCSSHNPPAPLPIST